MSVELGVAAKLEGFSQAATTLGSFDKHLKDIASTEQDWVRIQENLTQATHAHQAAMAQKSTELEKLKAHTADLIKKYNEQQAMEEAVNSGMFRAIQTMGSYALRVAGVATGWAALGTAYYLARDAALEAEMAGVRLDAMLAATGNTVGRTRQQLETYADALAKSTKFDDESIKNGMSILLSFGNVQGSVFDRAIKITADYAELLQTDFSSAARIVGRALEDPVHGLGMLGRAIGQVSPQHKEHIKLLWETGRTVEAQNELLDVLTKRFGGLSETMGTSATGASRQLGKAWNELLEEIGRTGNFVGSSSELFSSLASGMDNLRESVADIPIVARQAKMDLLALMAAAAERGGNLEAATRYNEEIIRMEERVTKSTATEMDKRKAAEEAALQKRKELQDENAARYEEKMAKEQEKFDKLQRHFTEESEKRYLHEREIARKNYDADVQLGQRSLDDYRWLLDAQLATVKRGSDEEARIKQDISKLNTRINKDYLEQIKDTERAEHQRDQTRKEESRMAVTAIETEVRGLDRIRELEGDARIQALQNIKTRLVDQAVAVDAIGGNTNAVWAAWRKVDEEQRKSLSSAELYRKQLAQIVGSLNFEMLNVAASFKTGLEGAFRDVLTGKTKNWDDFRLNVRDAFGSAITQEIARLTAAKVIDFTFTASKELWMLMTTTSAVQLTAGAEMGTAAGAQVVAGAEMMAAAKVQQTASLSSLGWYGLIVAAIFLLKDKIYDWYVALSQSFLDLEMSLDDMAKALQIPTLTEAINKLSEPMDKLYKVLSDFLYNFSPGGPGDGGIPGPPLPWPFATGGDFIAASPTNITVGEVGPERVTVSPLSGRTDRSGGVGVTVNGPLVMDYFTMRKFTRDLGRFADA